MLSGKKASYVRNYFRRFASETPLLTQPTPADCQLIVVIPCHNEPDLIGTLTSLMACQLPPYPVEIIIVVNQSENASEEVDVANKKTITDFHDWQQCTLNQSGLSFQLIEAMQLPKKHAGVGLARKTGMDEALRRFIALDYDGSIVCLDADCRVSSDYLMAIDKQFHQSEAGLGEMHFEHEYQLVSNHNLQEGIVYYELFLRYYVQGLKKAGFPHAIHTIGSCMLVKASVYAKYGGMNKRKAGEDFYFLHKIIPHESFTSVTAGTVFPSCRTSDRVPFGTGKAQQEWLDGENTDYLTHAPQVFTQLASVIASVEDFYQQPAQVVIQQLPEAVCHFFTVHSLDDKIELIKTNCRDLAQFHKQFFIWFDGFLCMKLIHFLRDNYYPEIPITQAASNLIDLPEQGAAVLLKAYRTIDLQQGSPQA